MSILDLYNLYNNSFFGKISVFHNQKDILSSRCETDYDQYSGIIHFPKQNATHLHSWKYHKTRS